MDPAICFFTLAVNSRTLLSHHLWCTQLLQQFLVTCSSTSHILLKWYGKQYGNTYEIWLLPLLCCRLFCCIKRNRNVIKTLSNIGLHWKLSNSNIHFKNDVINIVIILFSTFVFLAISSVHQFHFFFAIKLLGFICPYWSFNLIGCTARVHNLCNCLMLAHQPQCHDIINEITKVATANHIKRQWGQRRLRTLKTKEEEENGAEK